MIPIRESRQLRLRAQSTLENADLGLQYQRCISNILLSLIALFDLLFHKFNFLVRGCRNRPISDRFRIFSASSYNWSIFCSSEENTAIVDDKEARISAICDFRSHNAINC
jgi:hypothetical protein